MKTPSIGNIRYFLKAKKPEALMKLMLDNNIKKNAYHKYDVIFANGEWFAWYEQDNDREMMAAVGKVESK